MTILSKDYDEDDYTSSDDDDRSYDDDDDDDDRSYDDDYSDDQRARDKDDRSYDEGSQEDDWDSEEDEPPPDSAYFSNATEQSGDRSEYSRGEDNSRSSAKDDDNGRSYDSQHDEDRAPDSAYFSNATDQSDDRKKYKDDGSDDDSEDDDRSDDRKYSDEGSYDSQDDDDDDDSREEKAPDSAYFSNATDKSDERSFQDDNENESERSDIQEEMKRTSDQSDSDADKDVSETEKAPDSARFSAASEDSEEYSRNNEKYKDDGEKDDNSRSDYSRENSERAPDSSRFSASSKRSDDQSRDDDDDGNKDNGSENASPMGDHARSPVQVKTVSESDSDRYSDDDYSKDRDGNSNGNKGKHDPAVDQPEYSTTLNDTSKDEDSVDQRTLDTGYMSIGTDECIDFRGNSDHDPAVYAKKNDDTDTKDEDESETSEFEEWGAKKPAAFSYDSDDDNSATERGDSVGDSRGQPEEFEDDPVEKDVESGMRQQQGFDSDSDDESIVNIQPNMFKERSFDSDSDDEETERHPDRGIGENFEDEPEQNKPANGSKGTIGAKDDETKELLPDDEPEEDVPMLWGGAHRDKYKAMCCCLYLIIVAVVIYLRRRPKDDDDIASPLPSMAPTISPTSFADRIIFPVVSDTYLRGGTFADTVFGLSDKFEVQNGGTDESNSAYALLQFDLDGLPPDNVFQQRQLILRLHHVESTVENNHELTLVSLPPDPNLNIERLTWATFTPPDGEDGPRFQVAPSDTVIDVDITSIVQASASSLRGRRKLRPASLFLMLESRGTDQVGSVFRSREFRDMELRPMIIYNSEAQPLATPQPVVTSPPVAVEPTVSPTNQPTTSAPTVTAKPSETFAPSNAPSFSPAPSPVPSSSLDPTLSSAPSSSPTTCAEYVAPFFVPRLIDTDGAIENEFPAGALSYVSQNLTQVTLRITQLWTEETMVWIAPYYIDRSSGTGPFVCPKIREIAPGANLDYTIECFDEQVIFRMVVNDESLISGANMTLPRECSNDFDDIPGKQVLYTFLAKCGPAPVEC